MLKSVVAFVLLVAAPAFAQESRVDLAAVRALVTQAVQIAKQPVATVSVSDEVAKQLRADRAHAVPRLKVAR